MGVVLGLLFSVVFYLIYVMSSLYFTRLILTTHSYTYESVVRRILGPKWEIAFNILNFLFLMIMGITQTYLILTAVHGLLVSLFGDNHFLTSKIASAFYISPYLIYYSLKRKIKEMTWVSISNVIAMVLFVLFIIIFCIKSYAPVHSKYP